LPQSLAAASRRGNTGGVAARGLVGREQTNTLEREASARRVGGLELARSAGRLGDRLPVRAHVLLSLQQRAGNRAVRRLVQRLRSDEAVSPVQLQAAMVVQRQGGRRTRLGDDAVVLKVTIAGSGHDFWSTHKKQKKEGTWDPKQGGPTRWERPKGDEDQITEISYAGPGAPATTGLTGLSDTGSNRIAKLIKHVPKRVVGLLDEIHKGDPSTRKKRTVILIRAHSRGAVAAARVARDLKAQLPNVEIELVMFDPVPGPGHKGKNVKLDLSKAGLSEFTLVYSVGSGYLGGFSPQAVYGAKRIIITKAKHSAKTDVGFFHWENNKFVKYTGSNLNSLPAGVYVDAGGKGGLLKVEDMTEALAGLKEARDASPNVTDRKRKARITKVLDDYYKKAAEQAAKKGPAADRAKPKGKGKEKQTSRPGARGETEGAGAMVDLDSDTDEDSTLELEAEST
jgi:hypothetical protein